MTSRDSKGILAGALKDLPDPLALPECRGAFDVAISPPGSKSLANRVLLLAALAEGTSTLRNVPADADDVRVMIAALRRLGARIEAGVGAEAHVLRISGSAGTVRGGCELNLENAGTATRFLAAGAMLADGPVTVDGSERMRERPIGEQVSALRAMGVSAEFLLREGYPPVRIIPPARLEDLAGEVSFGRTASSQFISAVMLAAPFLPRGLRIRFTEPATSAEYIRMTARLLVLLGACVEGDLSALDKAGAALFIRAREQGTRGLRGFEWQIEPDASGASCFWSAAAMVPGASCLVPGLDGGSLQGDAGFVDILARMGATVERRSEGLRVLGTRTLAGIDVNMEGMPDAAMALAAIACFASGPSMIRGLRTLRVKETDRLAALARELSRTGAEVRIAGDGDGEGLHITPVNVERGVRSTRGRELVFDTYEDHRMAMALALVSLRMPGVQIRNPMCVAKTYPSFWRDWGRLVEAAGGAA